MTIWEDKTLAAMKDLGAKSENSAKSVEDIANKANIAKDQCANAITKFVGQKKVIRVPGKKKASYYLAEEPNTEELPQEEVELAPYSDIPTEEPYSDTPAAEPEPEPYS